MSGSAGLAVIKPSGPKGDLGMVVDYLAKRDALCEADIILALGSHCAHVPVHAAVLYHRGYAPLILFSGGRGRLTGEIAGTEAEFMLGRAVRAGVPESKILVEATSTNTLENVLYGARLLTELRVPVRRGLLVTQPPMQRRAWATAIRQWPGVEWVSCPPPVDFDRIVTDAEHAENLVRRVFEEVARLDLYGPKGDIAVQTMPAEVARAYRALTP
jgi:hypothetical protein